MYNTFFHSLNCCRRKCILLNCKIINNHEIINGIVIVSDREIRHKIQLGWLIRSTNQFNYSNQIHRKSHEGTRCKRLHMQSTSPAADRRSATTNLVLQASIVLCN